MPGYCAYCQEQDLEKDRKKAEIYFAKAILCQQSETYRPIATIVARACLNILKGLPQETLEDCATSSVLIDGIIMPDYLNYDMARRKFVRAGITLRP